MLRVWTDGSVTGGAWGSKKVVRSVPKNYIGWLVLHEDGSYLHHYSYYAGQAGHLTGNTAEHLAVNSVLRWLLQNGHKDQSLIIQLDSQLICGHLSGNFQVHQELLAQYTAATRKLIQEFPYTLFKWIPREQNKVADRLSKALQEKFEGRPLTREEVEAML